MLFISIGTWTLYIVMENEDNNLETYPGDFKLWNVVINIIIE